jgi:hypothetical protein
VAVCAVWLALPAGASRAADAPNILIVGWDGVQREHAFQMLDRGELPVLAALGAAGSLVEIEVVTGMTATKPGWAQILTGYTPEITGVVGNWTNYRPIPEGYTVFERAEEFFGPENIETRALTGKKFHLAKNPRQFIPYAKWMKRMTLKHRNHAYGVHRKHAEIVTRNGRKYVVLDPGPYLFTRRKMDEFTNGLWTNRHVGTRALEALEECRDRHFLFFVHFPESDFAGHRHGENSAEYEEAIRDADTWTGVLLDKLRALGLWERTLVYVAVDHGFDEGGTDHLDAPHVFLATNDPVPLRSGTREEIGPTILKRLGIPLEGITPPLSGHPLDE